MQPHRWQPTRLPHPWDSPGKNTGVGCHVLLHCVKVKSEVAQSCPTSSDPMDCSLPSMGFSRQEYWSGVPFAFSLHSGTLSKSLASLHPLSPLLSQDCCSLLGLFFSALSLKTKMPSRRKPRWVWAHLASLLSPFVALHWLLSNRVVYGG